MTAQHTRLDSTSLRVVAVGGGTISLPSDLVGSYRGVLFYRGS